MDVKGAISDIINNFAQHDNGITINLTDKLTSGSATTQITSSQANNFTININFNASYFSDISKEAVITRLAHEAVHAYLLHTNNTYRNLPKTEQHNYMFENYIEDMASYLISKYDLSDEEAFGLAWSGTELFAEADPEDTFSGFGIMTFEKSELNSAYAPYHNNDPEQRKGTPNCPNN